MYEQRNLDKSEEEERVFLTATEILQNNINCHEISVHSCPTLEAIVAGDQSHVPHIFQLLIRQIMKNPLKQESISQSLFSLTRPQVLLPLKIALSAAINIRYLSSELMFHSQN